MEATPLPSPKSLDVPWQYRSWLLSRPPVYSSNMVQPLGRPEFITRKYWGRAESATFSTGAGSVVGIGLSSRAGVDPTVGVAFGTTVGALAREDEHAADRRDGGQCNHDSRNGYHRKGSRGIILLASHNSKNGGGPGFVPQPERQRS